MKKIIGIRTGGQTGVDRAAMDFAREHGIPLCGWCPKNGWAEDYPDAPGLLTDYPELIETPSEDPAQRTKWNMRDSEAILTIMPENSVFSPGTETGLAEGEALGKPMYTAASLDDIKDIVKWVNSLPDGTELCVGGPRASECPEAYDIAKAILDALFEHLSGNGKKHYVYILKCADNTLYTGYTTDPERRTKVHNSGKGAKYTRSRRPVELIYTEEFDDRREAQRREYAIKQLTRAEKEKLIMKRLKLPVLLLCLVMTAMFAFSACGKSGEEAAEPQTKALSTEEIVDIAFDDAGIDPLAADDITVSPDDGSGIKKVSFIIEDAEYSYSIDTSTGEILDSAKPDEKPDVDPTKAAMRMVEQLPEFKDASNVNAVQNGDKVTVTFESEGISYKWIYDPADQTLTRQ